jgi:SNF2 family DNA or RNA helicase
MRGTARDRVIATPTGHGMAIELYELKSGLRLRGLVAAAEVTVVAVEAHGDGIANVVYRTDDGRIADRLVTAADALNFEVATGARWSFDAPGDSFKLASEARRIRLAHLFDPFAAVSSSTIQPLPHQIEAVYGRLLPLQPLHFLLADDPGAGKTIMSGLYIRELLLRGDLERCLIIAPGSLVEQWQEELDQKFSLRFDVMSRDMVEAARTGNPFQERNLLIVRLDQLSRSPELQAKLGVTDWDLVIFDEAHKLSAHLYGDEVKRTLRFELAELVRDHTRNLLLLTATPHNGSNDDFLLFMSILDPDRFTGRLRGGKKLPDVNDLMRRYVKESLLTFDGKRLFRERRATTVNYDLSPEEENLYEAVTSYVQDGMGKAQAMTEGGDKRRGLAVGFALAALQRRLASSPEAIFQSLRRRREKVAAQLVLQRVGRVAAASAPLNVGRLADPDGLDLDDFEGDELEKILQVGVDLPDIPPEVLNRQVFDAINECFAGMNDIGSFDEEAWPDVFMEVIRPLIRNMRDVRRYAAAVHGTVRELAGQIEQVDVLGLEAIRVFVPDVFAQLHSSIKGLTSTSGGYGSREDPIPKQQVDRLIEVAGEHAEVVRSMITRMFMGAQRHVGGSSCR